MSSLDLVLAQTLMRGCKMKARSFLSNLGTVSEAAVVEHETCEMGKWVYGAGMSNYGTQTEFRAVEKAHQQYHRTVKKIIELRKQGLFFDPEQHMTKLEELAGEVKYNLEALKKKIDAQK